MKEWSQHRESPNGSENNLPRMPVSLLLSLAPVTGFAMKSLLSRKTELPGAANAVEEAIPTAAMSAAVAKVTATVRELLSAPWDQALVVTPVGTVTVHSVSAGRVAVCTVRVRVASAPPELVEEATKLVEPQPGEVLRPVGLVAKVKYGKFNAMRSAGTSSAVLSLKVYEIEESDSVIGYASERALVRSAVA